MKSWIINNWAKVGGSIAVLMIIWVIFQKRVTEFSSLLQLHLAFLMLHQFEEYVYPGGFKVFFNKHIYRKNKAIQYPLSDHAVLFINIALGWTAYGYAIYFGSSFIALSLGLAAITLFNGILHISLALLHRKYNPGLYTSIFLFVPFGLYLLFRISKMVSTIEFWTGILIFGFGTFLIPFSLFLTSQIKYRNT